MRTLPGGSAHSGSQRTLGLHISQNAGTAFHAVADSNVDVSGGIDQHIHPRPEFDQAHALTALEAVSYFGMKHNSPRQQACNLLETHLLAVALHGDDILLVLLGACLAHGVQIPAALISHLANHACNRGTVHMHIKYAQKNAETRLLRAS